MNNKKVKLLVNVSVWSDSAIIPDRVIEFNTEKEWLKCIDNLISDLYEESNNRSSYRVGFDIESNVYYTFHNQNFERFEVKYRNLKGIYPEIMKKERNVQK